LSCPVREIEPAPAGNPKEIVMKGLIKSLALAIIASTVLTTIGCNTMEGAGKDTQKAGEAIQDTADRNK